MTNSGHGRCARGAAHTAATGLLQPGVDGLPGRRGVAGPGPGDRGRARDRRRHRPHRPGGARARADRAGWWRSSTSWACRRWPSCGPTGPPAACPARCGGSTPCGSGSAATRSGPAPTTRPASGSPTCRTWSPGVAEPPGPAEMQQLTDAILTGVFDGDLAIALERAAAFCRVVASGRAAPRRRAPTPAASTTRWRRRPDPARRLHADDRRGPRGLRPAVAPGRPALSRRIRRPSGRHRVPARRRWGYSLGASGRGSPGSQIKPLRAATCREALPARRADASPPAAPVTGAVTSVRRSDVRPGRVPRARGRVRW